LADLIQTSPKFFELLEQLLRGAPYLQRNGHAKLHSISLGAQRREEKLQEVPVSVTAFSEAAIRDSGIRNTGDFMAMTPNVSFDQSFTVGNSFVTMRGVEQINNADSPVAIVVDGVPPRLIEIDSARRHAVDTTNDVLGPDQLQMRIT